MIPKLHQIMSNFFQVEMENEILYFSYSTLIAFKRNGHVYARENVWGTNTGKHLNSISDKNNRLNETEFKHMYKGS